MAYLFESLFFDSSGPDESKSIFIDESLVGIFKQKYEEEFIKLTTIAEKLDFYDKNRDLFEFPYNQFTIRDYFRTQFCFDFKPIPHFLETHIYNPWFEERSKEYLEYKGRTKTGIPYHSCEELWGRFLYAKDNLPLLKKFIKHEKKKYKSLCEEHSPGRFDHWYKKNITYAQVWGNKHELTQDHWKEIIVKELVDYIIKLESYQESKETNTLKAIIVNKHTDVSLDKTVEKGNKAGSTRRVKEDISFPGLFKGDEKIMNSFLQVMKSKGYLTEEENWNFEEFDKGEVLAIIRHLERSGIIKTLKYKAELGRVFNDRFGEILSIRAYQDEPRYTIDPSLADALTELKNVHKK